MTLHLEIGGGFIFYIMLDIKGQTVNIGDRVLVSSEYHGLVLTTLVRETKNNYFFGDSVERIDKWKKLQYMGYTWTTDPATNIVTLVNKGDRGTKYKLQDMTNEKQVRVLKVEDDFSL